MDKGNHFILEKLKLSTSLWRRFTISHERVALPNYPHRAKAIPKGAWRLQLLSDRPLLPLTSESQEEGGGSDPSSKSSKKVAGGGPADSGGCDDAEDDGAGEGVGGSATTVVPCQNRMVFGGIYVPNKYLLLFRCVNFQRPLRRSCLSSVSFCRLC